MLEELLKIFYRTGENILGVVNHDGRLIGLLRKDRIVRELSDLKHDSVGGRVSDYLDLPLERDLEPIWKDEKSKLTIINLDAVVLDSWPRLQVIKAIEEMALPSVQSFKPGKVEKGMKASQVDWFREMVLDHIQNPLYSTDLEGKTLFYNKAFQIKILGHRKIQTQKKCEDLFTDLNREATAYMIKNGIDLNQGFRPADPFLSYHYCITPLLDEQREVRGYLYELYPIDESPRHAPPHNTAIPSNNAKDEINEINEKEPLQLDGDILTQFGNSDLTFILMQVEKQAILSALDQTQNNISHAAKILNIPRQTLQSRIKKVFDDSPVPHEAVIPRQKGVNVPAKPHPDSLVEKIIKKAKASEQERLNQKAMQNKSGLQSKTSPPKKRPANAKPDLKSDKNKSKPKKAANAKTTAKKTKKTNVKKSTRSKKTKK